MSEKFIVGLDHPHNDKICFQKEMFNNKNSAIEYIINNFYCDYFYIAKLDKNNLMQINSIRRIKTNSIKSRVFN